jgi:hypothetical protein
MSKLKRFKIRTRAQWVWIFGILIIGFLCPILSHLLDHFLFNETPSLRQMIISFIIFPIVGYFCSVHTWKIIQKK